MDEGKPSLNHYSQLPNPVEHSEVLDRLLEQVQPVNFREKLGIKPDDKAKISEIQVIIVEELLQLAKVNQWGLSLSNGQPYIFNGCFWQVIESDEIQAFIGQAAERMNFDRFKARYYQFRKQLFEQFICAGHFAPPRPAPGKVLINLQNGTFKVSPEGINLRVFDPADFIKYQLPFAYDPKATAPMFEKFLGRVLPEIELQAVIQEFLGYVFISTKVLKLEKTLLLFGTGANGKSVFFDIVNSLLGSQNVSSYSLQSLTNENGYFRAKLGDKLVNYASEISGQLQTAVFKQMVSGEPLEARLPYGNPFILTDYAKLIFNTNILPREVEHTNAYFRRFLIVPFNVTIPEAEQDPELAQKIILNELPGVFNWVLVGLKRLLENRKFTPSEIVKNMVQTYEAESDTVKQFLTEQNYIAALTAEPLKEIYAQYKNFCNDNGFKPLNNMNFSKRLKNLNFQTERKAAGMVVYLRREVKDEF